VPVVFDPATHKLVVGKGHVIGEGADVGFVSTGSMTERVIDACKHLEAQGIANSVFHSASIKPFDAAGLLEFASSVKRLVVCENHIASGGLATLVIDTLYEAGQHRPLLKIAIPDQFTECGSHAYLLDKYGLSTGRIQERVTAWLG
jgi:transketolase